MEHDFKSGVGGWYSLAADAFDEVPQLRFFHDSHPLELHAPTPGR